MITTSLPTSRSPRTTLRGSSTLPLVAPPQAPVWPSPTTFTSRLLSTLPDTCSRTSSPRATAASPWESAWASLRPTGTALPAVAVAPLPLLLPLAAAAAPPLLLPPTDHAAQARERVLALLSATAARNTDGVDQPPTTAAPVATPPSVLALVVVVQLPQHLLPPLLPNRSRLMVLAELRVVLLALARHSVPAARSTDGVDLPQDTAVPDARADRVLATRT